VIFDKFGARHGDGKAPLDGERWRCVKVVTEKPRKGCFRARMRVDDRRRMALRRCAGRGGRKRAQKNAEGAKHFGV